MCESGEPSNAVAASETVDEALTAPQQHLLELQDKITAMEAEKEQAKEEFGMQRAKMKDLYLQNEADRKRLQSDLEELRQQLAVSSLKRKQDLEEQKRKFIADIASNEQLLHETVEESSAARSHLEKELKQLQIANERLESELVECRKATSISGDDRHGEKDKVEPQAIPILSQATKTLARMVFSEHGADSSSNATKDSLEDSMRKAQEDAAVLRSLVVPLEEEIVALKEKLRQADEELQRFTRQQGAGVGGQFGSSHSKKNTETESESLLMVSPTTHADAASHEMQTSSHDKAQEKDLETFLSGGLGGSAASTINCNMCRNYETGLQKAQQKIKELEKSLEQAERNVQRTKDGLTREQAFRQEMEVKWNDKKEKHKIQVNELKRKITASENILRELQQNYDQTYQDVTEQLSRLQHDRISIKSEIEKLQAENDRLVGKYNEHSENLRDQVINLPDNVLELQELLLTRHEELIAAKVWAETQQSEADILREELQIYQLQNAQMIEEMQQLKVLLNKSESDRQRLHILQASEKQSLEQIKDLKSKLEKALQDQAQLEETVREQQSRISSLQHDLGVNEDVQKDFVRLSQSLQVQLEGFRRPNTQVRWQHEDDVSECPTCHVAFGSSNPRKHNCRHCGRIFCNSCLSHSVPSGPNQRLSRVCDVCHTLLVPHTAPYFSNEPPAALDS